MEKRIFAKELYIRAVSSLPPTCLFTAYVLHCLIADARFACNTAWLAFSPAFGCSSLNQSPLPRFSNAKGLDGLRRHRHSENNKIIFITRRKVLLNEG